MKKLLVLLTVLSIMLSTCIMGIGTTASALEVSPEGDFIAFDGVIEEYIGPGGVVVIPSEIDGEPTTEIAGRAFFKNTDITELYIPEGVEVIGHNAFEGCSNLYKLELPNSLYQAGANAFGSCIGLTAVTIPSNLTKVTYGMFTGCNALSDIKFSNGVQEIHQFAFCQTSPDRLVFPESIEFICGASFNYVQSRSTVEIVICNPKLDLGRNPKANSMWQDQINGAFTDTIFRPWNSSVTSNLVFRIIVPEDSDIAAFVKDWKNNGLLDVGKEDGACNNSYVVREEDEAYFEDIEEEIATYSIEKARPDLTFTSGGSADDTDNGTSDDGDDGNDGNNGNNGSSGNKNNGSSGNKNNNKNNGGSSTTTLVEEGDNSLIVTVLIVGGIIFLIIIVGAVVFAVIFLKKPKKAPAAPQVIYMMGPDGKIVPVAAEEIETPTEEAPVEEAAAEETPEENE